LSENIKFICASFRNR